MPQRFALRGIVGAGVKLAMHNLLSEGSRLRGKLDLLFMAATDAGLVSRRRFRAWQNDFC